MWCVRKFKTRSKATEACRKGRIKLNQQDVKPAVEVKVGDTVSYKVLPIWRQYEVLEIPKSRVGAKFVDELIREVTPWDDLEKLELSEIAKKQERQSGAGRPTKRERRDLDKFDY